jgi:hypothetical protein
MNKHDIIATLLFILESAIICLICLFCAVGISYRTKYIGEKRTYLRILIASLVCFFLFFSYGIIENYFGLGFKLLAPLWYLLFPSSLIFIVISLYLFFSTNDKREDK